MTALKKSLQTLGSIVAVGGMLAAAPLPAVAQQTNPCAPKAANPCAGKKKAANPCAPAAKKPQRRRRQIRVSLPIPARPRSKFEVRRSAEAVGTTTGRRLRIFRFPTRPTKRSFSRELLQ
jgi:hypothetical protein